MHKEKQKISKFFVVPGSGPSLLGMPDIDNLGVLTMNYETIARQLTLDNADNRKSNCQFERTVQTEGRMPESCTNKRQDAETQNQHNAVNNAKPSIFNNSMVISNDNNENSFLSEPINKDSKCFLSELIILGSEQIREDDMTVNVKQTSKRDNNTIESFISDQAKGLDIAAKTKQTKTK